MSVCDPTLGRPLVNFKLRIEKKEKIKFQDATARGVPKKLSLTLLLQVRKLRL